MILEIYLIGVVLTVLGFFWENRGSTLDEKLSLYEVLWIMLFSWIPVILLVTKHLHLSVIFKRLNKWYMDER